MSGASPAKTAMRAPSKGEAHVCPVHLSQDQFCRFQAQLLGFEHQYVEQVWQQGKQAASFQNALARQERFLQTPAQ